MTSADTGAPGGGPTPLVVLPAQRRLTLALNHLLAAIMLPWLGLIVGAATHVPWLSFAAAGAILAGVIGSFALRWKDRVEFFADYLVGWRGARSQRVEYRDVTRVGFAWFDPRRAFSPNAPASVTFAAGSGAPVVVHALYRDVQGPAELVADAVAARMGERLRAGETLSFVDRAKFPLGAVTLFGFFMLAALGMLAAFMAGERSNGVGAVRAVIFLVASGGFMLRSLSTWRNARRTGGVAVSSQGVAPLTSYDPASVPNAHYRAAPISAGWIPWGAIGAVSEDAYSLSFDAATLGRPVVVSHATENAFALGRLLRAESSRGRDAGAPSGVRIELAGDAPAADAEGPTEATVAASRRG